MTSPEAGPDNCMTFAQRLCRFYVSEDNTDMNVNGCKR